MEDLPTEPHSYNDTFPLTNHHQLPESGEAKEGGEEELDFNTPSLPTPQSPSPSRLDMNILDAYALWIPPLGLFGFHNYYLKRFPCAVLASVLPPIGLFIWLVDSCYIARFISQKRAKSLTTLSSFNSSASSSSDIGVEYPENYMALVEIATPSD
jgi:hypothetical protein